MSLHNLILLVAFNNFCLVANSPSDIYSYMLVKLVAICLPCSLCHQYILLVPNSPGSPSSLCVPRYFKCLLLIFSISILFAFISLKTPLPRQRGCTSIYAGGVNLKYHQLSAKYLSLQDLVPQIQIICSGIKKTN